MTALARVTVVVPTVGRPSLAVLLNSLAAQQVQPAAVVVADDRPVRSGRANPPLDALGRDRPLAVRVVATGGRGPAAARNAGWRSARSPWVCFLDDDVVTPPGWAGALARDLAGADAAVEGSGGGPVAAVAGRIVVPLPLSRRPTDWERSTAGLQTAHWATADMAVRRKALAEVGGFDERFPRAYREDADLALRLRRAGHRLTVGERQVVHPVRPAPCGVSVRVQRGNADDALMRAVHGPGWRQAAQTGRGALPGHVATVLAGATALVALAARRRRAAVSAAAAWAALTTVFAARRIVPGPRAAAEVAAMGWTSAVLPIAAVRWRLAGTARHGFPIHRARRTAAAWPPPVAAVLFDRDGTLVHDLPYNGDPDRVRLVDGAAEQVARLRAAGLRVGLVSNQSGVARRLLTRDQVDAVNARVAALVGGLDTVQVCKHGPDDGCWCRKPLPGMVIAAAAALGVPTGACVVVGDIGSDVAAAVQSGARAVLVPTGVTRTDEVDDADAAGAGVTVAADLASAVDLVLGSGTGQQVREVAA